MSHLPPVPAKDGSKQHTHARSHSQQTTGASGETPQHQHQHERHQHHESSQHRQQGETPIAAAFARAPVQQPLSPVHNHGEHRVKSPRSRLSTGPAQVIQHGSPYHHSHAEPRSPVHHDRPYHPSDRPTIVHPEPALVHTSPHTDQVVHHTSSLPNPNHPTLDPHSHSSPPTHQAHAEIHAPKPLSHKLIYALKKKPTLSRTWEKRSFVEEMRSAPARGTNNVMSEMLGSSMSRPTSLYTSPAALAAFRPLPPPHSAPATPAPPPRVI